ncbi:DUF4190 domain-containing protein [Gryllotalpicola reticulitermitis]|uniref:DUF4190 domain-containing protein n=1 Tax=Gryllotalpicola reticulitermitis TaxID=1184153 RepID=A0ABV8Q2M9_9MICO
MSTPNDPENSKPAAPQSPPEPTPPSAQPAPPYPYPAPAPAPQPTPPYGAPGQPQPAPANAGPQPQPQYPTSPYSATGYTSGAYTSAPHASPGRSALPPFNVMALITFIGAFVIPVVGIVCGHITLGEYRKGLPERGREYALAGLILGYIFTALWVVLAIVWIVFAFTHFGHASSGVRPGGGNFQRFGGGTGGGSGNGGGGFQFPTPGATPGS